MKIDTLNNNGVINDFSLHQEVSMPMRMPYPESWQKECEKEHGEEGKAQAGEAECRGRPEAGLPAGSGGAARGWLFHG